MTYDLRSQYSHDIRVITQGREPAWLHLWSGNQPGGRRYRGISKHHCTNLDINVVSGSGTGTATSSQSRKPAWRWVCSGELSSLTKTVVARIREPENRTSSRETISQVTVVFMALRWTLAWRLLSTRKSFNNSSSSEKSIVSRLAISVWHNSIRSIRETNLATVLVLGITSCGVFKQLRDFNRPRSYW